MWLRDGHDDAIDKAVIVPGSMCDACTMSVTMPTGVRKMTAPAATRFCSSRAMALMARSSAMSSVPHVMGILVMTQSLHRTQVGEGGAVPAHQADPIHRHVFGLGHLMPYTIYVALITLGRLLTSMSWWASSTDLMALYTWAEPTSVLLAGNRIRTR